MTGVEVELTTQQSEVSGDLPAAEYYAIALDYVEPGSSTDPEFLERVRGRATEFSLTDGQVRTLDLKLVSGF